MIELVSGFKDSWMEMWMNEWMARFVLRGPFYGLLSGY